MVEVPRDPLVVVDQVTTSVEDRAIAVHLDRLRMVRRVPVYEVDSGVIDELVREVAVRVGDVEAPVRPPVDRGDHDVPGHLRGGDGASDSLGAVGREIAQPVHAWRRDSDRPRNGNGAVDRAEGEDEQSVAVAQREDDGCLCLGDGASRARVRDPGARQGVEEEGDGGSRIRHVSGR